MQCSVQYVFFLDRKRNVSSTTAWSNKTINYSLNKAEWTVADNDCCNEVTSTCVTPGETLTNNDDDKTSATDNKH